MSAPDAATVAAVADVLAEHVRGDWSDRTYSCQGCGQRYEDETAKPETVEELREWRRGYVAVSHPGWSLDFYHAHLAAAILASEPIAQALAAVEAVARVEALADEWQGELDSRAIRDKDARYCWALATTELRAALRPEGGNQ